MTATALFEKAWTHSARRESNQYDEDTGEKLRAVTVTTNGRGLVQQAVWTGFTETTTTGIRDERVVMFTPDTPAEQFTIEPDDEFHDPQGRCWQAITEGMPRRIPGKQPEYWATQVRRAKEKDHG